MYAAFYADAPLVKELLDRGADSNTENELSRQLGDGRMRVAAHRPPRVLAARAVHSYVRYGTLLRTT